MPAIPDRRRGWLRWTRRTPVLIGLVVFVVAAAGASAWALIGSSVSNYRVATAGHGNVEQTFDLTGTVQPVDEATLTFQVAGKVAAVNVAAGQDVSSGQVLASLDTSSLTAAVTQDQSTLSADRSKLDSDEQSESSTTSSSSATTTDPAPAGGTTSNVSTQVTQAQRQLVADQRAVDADTAQATSDLQNAEAVCQSSGGSGGSSGGSGGQSSPCAADLSQVLGDQQEEAQELAAVSKDETTLVQLLSQLESSLQSSNQGEGSSQGTGTGRQASGTTTSGATATPATLASDQASIDAQQASVDNAEQSLSEANLTAPIAGLVSEVEMSVGQSVSAGSTSAEIVVQGPQAWEVVGDLSVSDIGEVQAGDVATVLPDGASQPVSGSVSEVSNTPASSSSSSSSSDYQLTVALPPSTTGLYNGSDAEVSVVTGEAHNVLTVPTSAVHRRGSTYYVEVLRNGAIASDPVEVGAMGDELTQITSGLSGGVSVILADLSTPIPTSTASGRSIVSLVGGGPVFVGPSGAGGFSRVVGGGTGSKG